MHLWAVRAKYTDEPPHPETSANGNSVFATFKMFFYFINGVCFSKIYLKFHTPIDGKHHVFSYLFLVWKICAGDHITICVVACCRRVTTNCWASWHNSTCLYSPFAWCLFGLITAILTLYFKNTCFCTMQSEGDHVLRSTFLRGTKFVLDEIWKRCCCVLATRFSFCHLFDWRIF